MQRKCCAAIPAPISGSGEMNKQMSGRQRGGDTIIPELDGVEVLNTRGRAELGESGDDREIGRVARGTPRGRSGDGEVVIEKAADRFV